MNGYELVIADCPESSAPVELYSVEKNKHKLVLANESLIDSTKIALEQSTAFLPFFAELYNISAKLEDYILVPTVLMPSDLPNRNAQAFPFSELVKADAESGQIGFETWGRMPTFIDHNNKDHTKAKGIIFSSTMRPILGAAGDLYKVVALLGFDRTRDPMLANSILTGERPSYSMGAWAREFACSICHAKHTSKHQGCEHISLAAPRMKEFDGKLSYLQAKGIKGFETSSVSRPAFFSATTPPDYHL